MTFFDLQNAGNSHVCSFGLKNGEIDHDFVRVMSAVLFNKSVPLTVSRQLLNS